MDDSNPNHFTRPGYNFWKIPDYNPDPRETKRAFTTTIPGGSLEKGYVVCTYYGLNALFTLMGEDEGGLHVKDLASNGALMQIGLNRKKTAASEDVWYADPLPRPGYTQKT